MKNYFNSTSIENFAAWILALVWVSPLLYAFWAAFHPQEYAINFEILAPLTLSNFAEAKAKIGRNLLPPEFKI